MGVRLSEYYLLFNVNVFSVNESVVLRINRFCIDSSPTIIKSDRTQIRPVQNC